MAILGHRGLLSGVDRFLEKKSTMKFIFLPFIIPSSEFLALTLSCCETEF